MRLFSDPWETDCSVSLPDITRHTWIPAVTIVNPELESHCEILSFKWKVGLALKLIISLTKSVCMPFISYIIF